MKVAANNTWLLLLVILLAQRNTSRTAIVTNEKQKNITLADPTIYHHTDLYYLFGTVEGSSNNGFKAYTSNNLKKWKRLDNNDGYVLKRGDAFGNSGFWAPQVFAIANKIYMAYVANENIALAESQHPAGPFTQRVKAPLAAPVKQIDPFIFIDDDGKKYLYHVRLQNGNRIFVAEMDSDLSAIKPETLKECIAATDTWENTAKAAWPVAEGPSVIKHKGTYYLLYTANDFRNPDYAVGYATSNSPLGPWKKYSGNPIMMKDDIGHNGTGHGDVFRKGKDWYYVFHTHNSTQKVAPRKTALIQLRWVPAKNEIDRIEINRSSFRFLFE